MKNPIILLVFILFAAPTASSPAQAAAERPPTHRAPPPPPDQDPSWTASAMEYRGRNGHQVEVACPAGGGLSSVWGNNPYTDDSSICSAAVHAGLLKPTTGGHVLIEIQAGREAFTGNYRNGVDSNHYGPWEGSFVFPQAAQNLEGEPKPPPDPAATTWWTNAMELRGRLGERFEFLCPPGGSAGSVWGNGPYTDDSSICSAAVHAKVISLAEGGRIWIEIQPGAPEYPGCARNGIRANQWADYPGGFIVVDGAGPCFDEIERVDGKPLVQWQTRGAELPGEPGKVHQLVCPPAGALGSIYGSNPYTDDTSVCTAAVHAGAITVKDGGPVVLEIRPGEKEYPESYQNEVQTSAWAEWPRSFLVRLPKR